MLRRTFTSLRSDAFVRNSAIIFFFSFAGSVANYVYQIYANRNLSPADYGLLNAILSLTIIASVVGDIIRQWITKCYSEIHSFKTYGAIGATTWYFLRVIAFLLAFLLLASLLLKNSFPSLIKADSPIGLLYLFIITALGYLSIVPGAFLDSFHEFFLRSWLGFAGVLMKLGMLFAFILIGFNMERALLAHLLGTGFTLALLFLGARHINASLKDQLKEQSKKKSDPRTSGKPVVDSRDFRLFFKIGSASIFTTFALNMDMSIARLVLDPNGSGDYATASTFGKAVFFLSVVIQPLLFVSVNDAYNRRLPFAPVLAKGLGFMGLMGIGGTVGLWLFIKPFASLLNPTYIKTIPSILFFALSILPYIFINFFATFFVSVNRYRIFVLSLGLLGLQAFLLYFWGREIHAFIAIRLATGGLILAVMVLYFFWRRKNFHFVQPIPQEPAPAPLP
ncbi:MAG: hypothetical protein JNM63_15175 [Spirochaetia bacterium]|nr:hypothetical protein [Spirochaetia bacterium]